MSPRPAIKFRLRAALYIAAAFSLLLTVYFFASYLTIKKNLIAKSDEEVYEQLDTILSFLHSPADEKNFLHLASLHNTTGEAPIAFELRLVDKPSVTFQSFGPPKIGELVHSHVFSERELPLTLRSEKNTIRILARSNSSFILYGAINTIAFDEAFDAMLRTYILLLISGIVFSFFIAMITAGFALKPLKILVASALKIKDSDYSGIAELPTDTRTLEINELALVINDILRERDRNISALRNFTADAAHELRTPLTILKGEFEVDLRTKNLTGAEKESVESNLEEVERLINIVEDLLTLTRAEQHETEEMPASFHIEELLAEVTGRLAPIALEQRVEIIDTVRSDLAVNLPKEDISHILSNILLNAIQFSSEGTSVTLASEEGRTGEFILSVQDNGAGISKEDIPHIFDRFWQGSAQRSSQRGTGLGLTIAKTFADRNGISLNCTSVLGEGTLMQCIFDKSKITR
jgi:signal transduction histidine kinase